MIVLRKGDSGPYVSMIQLALLRYGIETPTNGQFDDELFNIVKMFQEENKITSDGIVGENTWSLLKPYILGYREVKTATKTTLDEISEKYKISKERILVANPSVEDEIDEGKILIIPFDFSVVPTNIKYTAELVGYITEGILARYPFLESNSIGKSIMGNSITYIRIGKGDTHVFYNGEHHANEWITTPLLLKFAEEYSDAYAFDKNIFDASAKELFESKSLYIISAVNPDGIDIVNGGLPVGEYYNNVLAISKNYPKIPFPDGWKANVSGTDLNLNYPANWLKAKEIKYGLGFTSPAPRDFVGEEPLSAPESLAVYNFTVMHSFKLTLSYHTQGRVIYWKYLNYLPKNSYKIAQSLSEVSGYEVSLTPAMSAYAGYKDWFIQAFDKPGYTIEAGIGENPLPLSQFDEIYNDNIGIMVRALELA